MFKKHALQVKMVKAEEAQTDVVKRQPRFTPEEMTLVKDTAKQLAITIGLFFATAKALDIAEEVILRMIPDKK